MMWPGIVGAAWAAGVLGWYEWRQPIDWSAAWAALDAGSANALPIGTPGGFLVCVQTVGGNVAGLAAVAALAFGGWRAGALGVRWLRADGTGSVGCLGLGWVLAGTAALGLGLAGLYDRVTLGLIAAGSLAVPVGPKDGWRERLRALVPPAAPPGLPRFARWCGWMVLGLVTVSLLSPENAIDSGIYQLAVPARAIRLHKLVPMVSNFFFDLPAQADLVRGWTWAFAGDPGARAWTAAAVLAGAAALVALVAPAAGAGAGWLAAGVWASSPFVVGLAEVDKADLTGAALLLSATVVALGRRTGGEALLAGVLAGGAAAAKGTCAPFAVLLGLGIPLLAGGPRGFTDAVRGLAGLACSVGAWSVRAWLLTGDPAYPLGVHRIGLSSDGAATAAAERASEMIRGDYHGTWGRLLSPWTATMVDGLSPVWLAAGPLILAAVVAAPTRSRARVLGWLGLAGWGVWTLGPPQLRFGLPALGWLLAAAAAATATVRMPALTPLAGAALGGQLLRSAAQVAAAGTLLAGLGLEGHEAERARVLSTYGEAEGWLARETPAGSRVLAVGELRSFPASRPTVVASLHEPPAFYPMVRASATADEVARRMRQLGIRYVLHNPAAAMYNRRFQTVYPWTARDLAVWADYWRRYVRLVLLPDRLDLAMGGSYVYRIATERSAPAVTPTLPGVEGALGSLEGWLRRGDLPRVANLTDGLEQVVGDFPQIKAFLGEFAWNAQDEYRTAGYLKAAMAGEYRDLGLLAELARREEERGHLTDALGYREEMNRYEPRCADAVEVRLLVKLAREAKRIRRPERAEPYFRRALEITPRDAALWAELSDLLVWLDRRREALEAMEHAVELNPAHPGYRGTLGHLLRSTS